MKPAKSQDVLKGVLPGILRGDPNLKRKAQSLKDFTAKRLRFMKGLDEIFSEEEALRFEFEQDVQDSHPWILRFEAIVKGKSAPIEFGLSTAMLQELFLMEDPEQADITLRGSFDILDNLVSDANIGSLLREDLLHLAKCTMQLRKGLRDMHGSLECRCTDLLHKLTSRFEFYDWLRIKPAEAEVSRSVLDEIDAFPIFARNMLESFLQQKERQINFK